MKDNKIIVIITIVVVVILLIIGGDLYLNREPELVVKEGYAKLEYSVSNLTVIIVNRTVSAVAIINNGDGTLNLTVTLDACVVDNNLLDIHLNIVVMGNLPQHIVPEGVKIKPAELDNSTTNYDFLTSFNHGINATPWDDNEISPGAWAPYTAYVGFTPHSSKFESNSAIDMEIHDYKTIPTHTLRI